MTVSASFRGMNNSSDELILALKGLADRHGALLQTHACYSYFTRDSSVSQFGRPEVERLESLGVLDERMLLLHSGWFEPHEIAILARRKPNLVCCPSSSLHNGYGNLAAGQHPELMALGLNVSLGTDHASSGTVDLVQEMRNCACGYKEIRLNPRVMPPEQAVEMATINGARGAGLDDRIGSIVPGKSADLAAIALDSVETMPCFDPASHMVYAAGREHVTHAWVEGRARLAERRLVGLDERDLRDKAAWWQRKMA
jgi:5-methylthioadenosine/S-adenosylhomocysteine deaminase